MKARELSMAAATVGSSIAAMCGDGSIKVSDRTRSGLAAAATIATTPP
jgi:hypothetical protein